MPPTRSRSIAQGCFHTGGSGSLSSTRKGRASTFTESPRSLLKPTASCTSEVSLAISSGEGGALLDLPLASVVWRKFTSTATFTRLMACDWLRVLRTVLSTS